MKKAILKNTYRLLLLIIIVVCLLKFKPFQHGADETEVTHTMVVHQIEELGKLEVAKYGISDVIEYTKKRTWLPNSRTAIMVMGEVVSCIDLNKLDPNHVKVIDGDSLRIILPLPEICGFKVDHSKSKIYDVKYGLWETHELVDEAYKEAERKIHEQALSMGITEESKTNARKAIRRFLQVIGYSRVWIGFEETISTEQSVALL